MASGLENIETVESPFRRFVTTIGVFPTAFTDAMTYYECLAYLVKYMEDTLIPAINENAEAVEELQGLYIQLKAFVDNYFENLDVQEEINNKLDQMVEDGTLQEIITSYIQANVAWTFDTVANMKASTNLINGSYAQTLGYHSKNDGGAGIYYIDASGVANEMDIIAISDTLKAHLITSKTLYPEMLGAYADGTHDDSNALQRTIDLTGCNVELLAGKVYSYATTLNITRRYYKINGNGATLKYTGTGNALYVDMSGSTSHMRDITAIQDIVFNAPNSQNVLALNYCIKGKFENLKIYDFPHNGINLINGCYECNFNNIYLGCRKVAGTVGITGKFGDTEFGNLYGVNVETFIFGTAWGSNCIEKIHAWCFNGTIFDDEPAMDESDYNAWLANTVLIKVDNTTEANAWDTVIEYCNCDTYKTCINWQSYWRNLHINNMHMHGTTNLIVTNSTYQDYVHHIKIDSLTCPDAIVNTIETTQASRIPNIKYINDNEYMYAQIQTYTDYNNNTQTIVCRPNEPVWLRIEKPSADLTLTGMKAVAFMSFAFDSAGDLALKRPYVAQSSGNSFIYTSWFPEGVTRGYILIESNGYISSGNARLVKKPTFTV